MERHKKVSPLVVGDDSPVVERHKIICITGQDHLIAALAQDLRSTPGNGKDIVLFDDPLSGGPPVKSAVAGVDDNPPYTVAADA